MAALSGSLTTETDEVHRYHDTARAGCRDCGSHQIMVEIELLTEQTEAVYVFCDNCLRPRNRHERKPRTWAWAV